MKSRPDTAKVREALQWLTEKAAGNDHVNEHELARNHDLVDTALHWASTPQMECCCGPDESAMHDLDDCPLPVRIRRPTPMVCKWDDATNGYVPVTDSVEAREAAAKCIYPMRRGQGP